MKVETKSEPTLKEVMTDMDESQKGNDVDEMTPEQVEYYHRLTWMILNSDVSQNHLPDTAKDLEQLCPYSEDTDRILPVRDALYGLIDAHKAMAAIEGFIPGKVFRAAQKNWEKSRVIRETKPLISLTPTDDGTPWKLVFNIEDLSKLDKTGSGAESNHGVGELYEILSAYLEMQKAAEDLNGRNCWLKNKISGHG